uniref:Ribosomal RNA-processing protein 42 n=1 Tax=Echinococcus granulosus TaxID=6210 RepID=A0A068WNV5_ECHGR|nr:exosome complex exonuclease rrp43 [Echinococcus granulosus]
MNDLGLLKPVCLFEQFFDHKLRLNNIPYDEFAPFSCCTGVISTAAGSAMVSVGATRVICGIKVKVLPSPENAALPLICNIEHMSLAQRGQRISPAPSKELQSLAVQLEWILISVALPDVKSQLLIHSERDGVGGSFSSGTYLIHIDVAIVLDDGCLLDACLAAALAALETASWPRLVAVPLPLQTTGSAVSALKMEFREKTPIEVMKLVLSERPVALSFALVPRAPPNASLEAIFQPSRSENLLWDTDASICRLVVDSHGRVVDFAMVGGIAFGLWQHLDISSTSENTISSLVRQIISRATEHAPLVRQQLNAKNDD